MKIDIVKWIKGWKLSNFFHSFKENAAKVAITITEGVKTATEGTLLKTLADIIDGALKSHVATDVLNIVHSVALKALAAELAIEALPDNPTEADVLKFEQDVYTAISGKSPYGQSKLWTTFAAQMFGILHEQLDQTTTLTYAQVIEDIERAYQDYLKDKADNA